MSNPGKVVRRGQTRVVTFNVMQHLMNIYGSFWSALKEAIDNELDAGAQNLTIELCPDQIVITGDGSGMVPYMHPSEEKTLEAYIANVGTGAYPQDFDIRTELSSAALASLQWLQECIALSSRVAGKQGIVQGMRGLGALAPYTYGQEVTYITRPSRALYEAWGQDSSAVVPTYRLDPPTAAAYAAHDLSYEITVSGEALRDASGGIMEHGTKVVVTGLRDEYRDQMAPGIVAARARSHFAEYLKQGAHITIIDKVSTAGKKSPCGIETKLEPPEYKGSLVLETTFWVKIRPDKQPVPCDILVYYNPRGRSTQNHIMVRRMKTPQFDLGTLEAFEGTIFAGGHYHGYVDFPAPNMEQHGMSDEHLWDGPKHLLLTSKIRSDWEKVILRFSDDIKRETRRKTEKIREASLSQFGNRLSVALTAATNRSEVFRGSGGQLRPSKPKTGKKRAEPGDTLPAVFRQSVMVAVTDEHNQPVEGVTLDLMKDGQVIASKVTGRSGEKSFGKREIGKYRIRMVTPEGVEAYGLSTYVFDLTEYRPGYQATFKVTTGRPKPKKKEGLQVSVSWTYLDDPVKPWDMAVIGSSHVRVRINRGCLPMAAVLEAQDGAMSAVLATQYVTSAVTLASFQTLQGKGDLGFILEEGSNLFGDSYVAIADSPVELDISKRKKV